jgi:hypothetical protein
MPRGRARFLGIDSVTETDTVLSKKTKKKEKEKTHVFTVAIFRSDI